MMRLPAFLFVMLTALPAFAEDGRYVMHRFDETYLLDTQTGRTWVMTSGGRWEAVPFSVEAADRGPVVPGGKAARESRLKRWESDGSARRLPAKKGGEQPKKDKAQENLETLKKLIR